ncbi:MAG: hypothetical protein ACOYXN_03245 [Acidobacteriota bacterium]
MNLKVAEDQDGAAFLTNESANSSRGLPVLHLTGEGLNADFGPADELSPGVSAAGVVAGWAQDPQRTPEELRAAAAYLSQWPEGPQVSSEIPDLILEASEALDPNHQGVQWPDPIEWDGRPLRDQARDLSALLDAEAAGESDEARASRLRRLSARLWASVERG